MLTTEQFIKILNEKLEKKFEQKIIPLNQTIVDLKSKVKDVVEHITFINAKYNELYLKGHSTPRTSVAHKKALYEPTLE